MKLKALLIAGLLLSGCGSKDHGDHRTTNNNNDKEIEKLKAQVAALIGTQTEIDNLIKSEFSTCDAGAGATTDVLIRKICNVAKAATDESKVEMAGQLSAFSQMIKSKTDAINLDILQVQSDLSTERGRIDDLQSDMADIQSDILDLQSQIDDLESRMDDVESAIDALETLTNSINGVIASNLIATEIGTENVGAGPLYESLLVRQDRSRINGYVEALSAAVSISNNGIDCNNGSSTVTVTTSANHGLSAGNLIRIQGATAGSGILIADLVEDMVVVTAPTATTFTLVLARNCTSNTNIGGSGASVRHVSGRGLGTLWTSAMASDAAVRSTNFGSKNYNFIIKKGLTGAPSASHGYICYDKTNHAATFATINAATSVTPGGNLVCK